MTQDELTRLKELAEKARAAKSGIDTYHADAEASISDADYEDWEEDMGLFSHACTPELILSLLARCERAEADLSCFELLDVQRVARIFDISENAAEDGLEHGFLYRRLTVPPSEES